MNGKYFCRIASGFLTVGLIGSANVLAGRPGERGQQPQGNTASTRQSIDTNQQAFEAFLDIILSRPENPLPSLLPKLNTNFRNRATNLGQQNQSESGNEGVDISIKIMPEHNFGPPPLVPYTPLPADTYQQNQGESRNEGVDMSVTTLPTTPTYVFAPVTCVPMPPTASRQNQRKNVRVNAPKHPLLSGKRSRKGIYGKGYEAEKIKRKLGDFDAEHSWAFKELKAFYGAKPRFKNVKELLQLMREDLVTEGISLPPLDRDEERSFPLTIEYVERYYNIIVPRLSNYVMLVPHFSS